MQFGQTLFYIIAYAMMKLVMAVSRDIQIGNFITYYMNGVKDSGIVLVVITAISASFTFRTLKIRTKNNILLVWHDFNFLT